MHSGGMDAKYRAVPDGLWGAVRPLLPPERPKPKGGRPRVPDRGVLAGILYRLRTGCQWKALPSEFSSGSTCHLRMQEWARAGVFTEAFEALLRRYDRRRGIAWQWTALDALIVKAPKGGTSPARTPRTGRSGAPSATS
jgi:transposase